MAVCWHVAPVRSITRRCQGVHRAGDARPVRDDAILPIAYDNVHYKDQPEDWNIRMVLGIATVLGVIGVIAFRIFYLGERVFHLDRAHI